MPMKSLASEVHKVHHSILALKMEESELTNRLQIVNAEITNQEERFSLLIGGDTRAQVQRKSASEAAKKAARTRKSNLRLAQPKRKIPVAKYGHNGNGEKIVSFLKKADAAKTPAQIAEGTGIEVRYVHPSLSYLIEKAKVARKKMMNGGNKPVNHYELV